MNQTCTVKKYTFGTPFPTHAVVREVPAETGEVQELLVKGEGRVLQLLLDAEDIVFGLGEQVRGLNKRGWKYISNNTDESNHAEGKHSLYGSHNFLLVDGIEKIGLFVDTPGRVTFDIGYSMSEQMRIEVEDPDYDLYVITGPSSDAVVRCFRGLIGRSYIPPRWAFGYGQSRWSYETADEVREVVREHRERGIPLDMVYLDIDYMDQYEDFTVDETKFPDFAGFVQEMKEQHVHLVPIIDAGVKKAEGTYPVYDEGMEKGYFCKDESGKPYEVAVWPGRSYLPDFFREDVRTWFGDQYRSLLDLGIDGFWNDMNEPAIFYSDRRLKETFEKIGEFQKQNLDVHSFFEFLDTITGLFNSPEDYKALWHDTEVGRVCHDKVHNLYGALMTRAASEGFRRAEPEKRVLMFSRSSYIGSHRDAGIWQGDNKSWWSHLKLSVQMTASLNMCGFLYTGADAGGFADDVSPDLLLRWLGFAIFTPLLRNHSMRGTRRQEIWRMVRTEECKQILSLRYAFLPYIYSEYMKAAFADDMLFKPLAFAYPEDHRARHVEDQLLFGEGLMLAPVVEQNAWGRYVYLPEDMKLLRMRSAQDYDEEILEKGDHWVPAMEHEVLVFIRPDRLVPFGSGSAMYVDEVSETGLSVLGYVKTKASYELYTDDGVRRVERLEDGELSRFESFR